MLFFVRIFAMLLVGVGLVWILQGVNILPGSFMTGQIAWAYRGAGTVVLGLVLFFFARRKLS
jgi:hypothetical protein